MSGIVQVRNALFSVREKTDEFSEMVKILHECGVNFYSSGGTATHIRDVVGLPVTDVADYTGFSALFGHRVVTLHPKVHGGILYRRDSQEDVEEAKSRGIVPFDFVAVNFYPAQAAMQKEGAKVGDVVEATDVGGPCMVNAAAKNHDHVAVVVDEKDYIPAARQVQNAGGFTLAQRIGLAQKGHETTGKYYTDLGEFYNGLKGEPLK